jgi:acyl-CoA reductase-like NAD-dependent aldehyde dehydrogenase
MLQLECSELILNHAWIDNQKTGSSDGRTFTVEDPADGTVLATLPDCGPVEAEARHRRAAGLLQLAHAAGERTGTRDLD